MTPHSWIGEAVGASIGESEGCSLGARVSGASSWQVISLSGFC